MIAPVLFVFALSSSIPQLNLQQTCRGAQSGALPEDKANAYRSCINDETVARSQVQRVWGRVSPAIRQSCTDEATGISPSYVELLTCLEMRSGGNFSGAENSVTPPPVAPAPAAPVGSTPANPIAPATPGATTPNAATPGATTPGTPRPLNPTPKAPAK